MKHFKALIISNQSITAKILNWKLDKVETVEKALTILQQQDYRIVAIDNSFDETDKQKLDAIAKLFNKEVIIATFSTNEGLKMNISRAYRNQRAVSIKNKFLDNAFEIELACKLNMN